MKRSRDDTGMDEIEKLGNVEEITAATTSGGNGTSNGVTHEPAASFPEMNAVAFHGLAGEIVGLIDPHTESDPNALLLNALTFFGNVVGRGPFYLVEGTRHTSNLFVLQVGDSAKSRKGTGADRMRQLFELADSGADEWAKHRIDTGLSSGEGVIWAVHDRITKLGKDGTEEVVDQGIADKRLLLLEPEFAGVLKVMQREGNILSRVLRDAWDRGYLATITRTSNAKATGACISIIGHITSTELRACLDKTEMSNGFGNRFLFACVKRSKQLPFGGDLRPHDMSPVASKIRVAIDKAQALDRVQMDDEAKRIWAAVYAQLSQDRPGLMGALMARSEAQAVRLALIYALINSHDAIEKADLIAGLAVVDYCRQSLSYIFGDTLGDPAADTILASLKACGASGMTRTDISGLFARHMQSSQIARALAELQKRDLAQMLKDGTTPGRPVERWAYKDAGSIEAVQ